MSTLITLLGRSLGFLVLLAGPTAPLASQSAEVPLAVGKASDLFPFWIGVAAAGKEARVSSSLSGQILTVTVEEGQTVAAGDLLCRLDDRVQTVRTTMAKVDAESTLAVDLARAKSELAARHLTRLTGLRGTDSATSKELTDAAAEAEMSNLALAMACHEQEQAKRTYEREQAALAQYDVRAPFAGYVARIHKQAGERIEPGDVAVTLRQLDPLDVTLDCALVDYASFSVGDSVVVQPFETAWPERIGKVWLVSRSADAASQTTRVRIAVPNEREDWIAGIKVRVHAKRRNGNRDVQ